MSNRQPNAGAAALRAWRHQNSVTQKSVAAGTGIVQELLSKYELSRHRPEYQNRKQLSAFTAGAVTVDSWDEPAPQEAAREPAPVTASTAAA